MPEVPSWLRGLTGLERLDLSNNMLTTLPAWLGELPSLARIDVSRNPIPEPPDLNSVAEVPIVLPWRAGG